MALKIQFKRQVIVDGDLTDATTAIMSDETGTYAVKRLDNGDIVVPAVPTVEPVHESLGTYVYTLEAPVHTPISGVTYRAVFRFVVGGITYWVPTEVTAGPSVAWLDYDKFVRRFGLRNIAIASDKNNENDPPVVNYDMVDDAFIWAEAEINRHLRGGVYAVPLVWTRNAGIVDPAVEEWGYVLAYHHIYYGRFEDANMISDPMNNDNNQLSKTVSRLVSQTYADIAMCRSGIVRLNADIALDHEGLSVPRADFVVTAADVASVRYREYRGVVFPALP